MQAVLLFASSYVVVLLLVVQSANNIHGYAGRAFFTSIGIGVAQVTLYKLVPDGSLVEIAAFVAGGAVGNTTAHFINRNHIARIRKLHREES